jgi:hypothetical protein
MQPLLFIALPLIFVLLVFIALEVWLWRRGPIGKLVCLVLFSVPMFEIYAAVYPLESFYKTEFSRVTGNDFPVSGRFKFKETSFPDIHGDHTSCAVIEVSEKDYEVLHSKVGVLTSSRAEDECMYHLWATLGKVDFLAESSECTPGGECTYWALVAGRREVVVHYSSW